MSTGSMRMGIQNSLKVMLLFSAIIASSLMSGCGANVEPESQLQKESSGSVTKGREAQKKADAVRKAILNAVSNGDVATVKKLIEENKIE